MPNTLLNPSIIAKEALMQLENNAVMASNVYTDYKNEFGKKVGDTISIRKPVQFEVSDGATLVTQDVTETKDTLTLAHRKHVAWEFSSQDLTLTIEQYSKRYVQPAMIQLANYIDLTLFNEYTGVASSIGTPGTTPNGFAIAADAAKRLDNQAVPMDGQRKLMLNPDGAWDITKGLTSILNPQITAQSVKKGLLSTIASMETYSAQNVATHTVGVATGTPLVNGAGQTGASLVTDGWTSSKAGILKAGDVFTIDGVYAVNPVGKQKLSYLQQFTVTADVDSGATTGPATIPIYPAITTSGPYQTVSAGPADNAAITVLGAGGGVYPQNLAFHKNAFCLATVPLMLPDSAAFKSRIQHNGISMRMIKAYDVTNDKEVVRIDILFGTKALDPRLATRVWG